jgi:hypothetical protein
MAAGCADTAVCVVALLAVALFALVAFINLAQESVMNKSHYY